MQERSEYIDIAKGLGMFLVIWGHIKHGGITPSFVYSFHMPLFFFISGMLFNCSGNKSFLPFIKKRARRLLVPYICYSIVTWLLWVGYNTFAHKDIANIFNPLLQTFIAQGSTGYLVHNTPLWFITCLFMVEVMFFFIIKLGHRGAIALSFVTAMTSMFLVGKIAWFSELPWNIEVALVAVFFYACGSMVRENLSLNALYQMVSSHKGISLITVLTLGGAIILLSGIYDGADMGADYFTQNHLIFLIMGTMGSIMTVVLAALICCLTRNRFTKTVRRFIDWFGQQSMDVLSIHVPIKGIIVVFLAKAFSIPLQDSYFFGWKESVMAFILTTACTAFMVYLISFMKKKFNYNVR